MPEDRGWLGDGWAFTKSLGGGLWDAGAGVVEGVGELAKGGYALATDEKARESAWNTTKKLAKTTEEYAGEVWEDPAKAYRDARDGAASAYNDFEKAKQQAEAEGRSAEFWGDLTGKGIFEIGSILVPVGLASKAGKLGKVVDAADDLTDVAKKAKQLDNAEDIASASQRAKNIVNNDIMDVKDKPPCTVEGCPFKKKIQDKNQSEIESKEKILSPEELELNIKVENDAKEHILKGTKKKLGKDNAISRAVANGETTESFVNIKSYKTVSDIKGVEIVNDGYIISDKEKYMSNLKSLYGKNTLNPQMEKRISDYIGNDTDKVWNNRYGLPGFHAEVQSTNNLLNKGAKPDDISVSTYKVSPDKYGKQGTNFPACANCKGILDGFVKNITTGVVK